MNRQELTALRDALDALLVWPDGVLVQMARWLADVAKPNGRDPAPPVPSAPGPGKAKARNSFEAARRAKLTEARTAEQRLIAAMKDNPSMSVIALANAVDASRSTTGERLRRLSAAGKVEKDHSGRWRLVEEKARPMGYESRPTMAPSSP